MAPSGKKTRPPQVALTIIVMMPDGKIHKTRRDLLLGDLEERGWCCHYVRIDTGSDGVFVFAADRAGIHHIIVSDQLLPALAELYNSLIDLPASSG
jgi:hypothetical protein